VSDDGDHPAIFPVALPEFVMRSWPGICYEPFAGSGTTIIAAEITSSACYACEIHPQYADIAALRFEKFSGKQATLDTDGRTFEEVKLERTRNQAEAAAEQ
jgi:DNA modification methylase